MFNIGEAQHLVLGSDASAAMEWSLSFVVKLASFLGSRIKIRVHQKGTDFR